MSRRLYHLAVAHYPESPVVGAILARHERMGLVLAILPATLVPVVCESLGWPVWLGGALGSALALAGYALRRDNFVLVLTSPYLRLHRPGRMWFRVPLGNFDREVAADELRVHRRGVFNDSWLVDGIKMNVNKAESEQLRQFVGIQPLQSVPTN